MNTTQGPLGGQPPQPPQPPIYYPPAGYTQPKATSGYAIAAMCTGIAGIMMWPIALFSGPVAIWLAKRGIRETKDDGPKKGHGFAIAGVATGIASLVIGLVMWLFMGFYFWLFFSPGGMFGEKGFFGRMEEQRRARDERRIEREHNEIVEGARKLKELLREYHQLNGRTFDQEPSEDDGEARQVYPYSLSAYELVNSILRMDSRKQRSISYGDRYGITVTGPSSAEILHLETGTIFEIQDINTGRMIKHEPGSDVESDAPAKWEEGNYKE